MKSVELIHCQVLMKEIKRLQDELDRKKFLLTVHTKNLTDKEKLQLVGEVN